MVHFFDDPINEWWNFRVESRVVFHGTTSAPRDNTIKNRLIPIFANKWTAGITWKFSKIYPWFSNIFLWLNKFIHTLASILSSISLTISVNVRNTRAKFSLKNDRLFTPSLIIATLIVFNSIFGFWIEEKISSSWSFLKNKASKFTIFVTIWTAHHIYSNVMKFIRRWPARLKRSPTSHVTVTTSCRMNSLLRKANCLPTLS